MEAILRDSLLLLFCWILPMIISLNLLARLIIWLIRISTRPIRKKFLILQKIAQKIRLPKLTFTFFNSKISSLAFFSVYIALLLTVTVFFFSTYFYSRPYVSYKSIQDFSTFSNEDEAIEVLFDRPFYTKRLQVITAPENIGARITFSSPFTPVLDYIEDLTGLKIAPPYYTKVSIYPENSIPYESGFVFYIRNIASITQTGGLHEYAITLSTPNFPEVKGTFPNDEDIDIPIDSNINILFDSTVTGSLNLTLVSEPETESTFIKTSEKNGEIKFTEKLKQGTKYAFTIITKEQRSNLSSGKIQSTSDTENEYKFDFTTVTPAGIKSILPKGESVKPDSQFVITFTEPMDIKSVEENITISPKIEYKGEWDEDEAVFTIIPTEKLEKATKYNLNLSEKVMTKKKGVLEAEVDHTFETLGYIKVVAFSPRNGSTGNSITSPIAITFDQEVDHASAQSHVNFSPGVAVKYTWSGNKLTMYPSTSMSYSKKYTVTISEGIKSIEGLDSKTKYTYSFSTRSQVVTIYVPRYIQPGTFDCNLTATSMALAAKGVTASVNAVRAGVGSGTPYNSATLTGGNPNSNWIANYGVHWGPIASYIRSRGRGADVKSGWSLSGIAHEIQNGNPVIIWWYNGVSSTTMNSWYTSVGGKPGMHSVVVYGFKGSESNPTHLYVKDPWFSYYYYSASTFTARWNYLGRKAVVVK